MDSPREQPMKKDRLSRNNRYSIVLRNAGAHWNWLVMDSFNQVVDKGFERSRDMAQKSASRVYNEVRKLNPDLSEAQRSRSATAGLEQRNKCN